DRDHDRLVVPTRLTLTAYIDQWAEKALRGRVTPRTFDRYQTDLRAYLLPTLGDKRLSSISAWDIQAIYASMTARGLSSNTVRRAHAPLRSALKQAVRGRILPSNPADSVDLPSG